MRYWNGHCYRDHHNDQFVPQTATHAELDAIPAVDRNTGETYMTGFHRTVTDDEHRKNLIPMIKLGCSECTFTWEEPDRDDMILTPDHNSHHTEPCEGSGEPAVCL